MYNPSVGNRYKATLYLVLAMNTSPTQTLMQRLPRTAYLQTRRDSELELITSPLNHNQLFGLDHVRRSQRWKLLFGHRRPLSLELSEGQSVRDAAGSCVKDEVSRG